MRRQPSLRRDGRKLDHAKLGTSSIHLFDASIISNNHSSTSSISSTITSMVSIQVFSGAGRSSGVLGARAVITSTRLGGQAL
jgi:hypothetical protein